MCAIALVLGCTMAIAQQATVRQVQPMIMVVPFTKEGENVRKVLDDDLNRRVAITKVKEAFDNRGFSTVDFIAKVKATAVDQVVGGETQTDVKKMIIEASGADIYVEVEVAQVAGYGNASAARIILTAYDAFTGISLANKTGASEGFTGVDFGKLVEKALNTQSGQSPAMLEDFLNVMQTKFTDIVENGRTIKVQFNLSQDAEYDMDSEIGQDGRILSEVLQDWIADNAYKNNYSNPRSTAKTFLVDEVRIPLRDEKTNRNFMPSQFGRQIRIFCNTLKLRESPDRALRATVDARGGTLLITLQ